MFNPFGWTPEIQRKADEQEAIIGIMMLFPDGQYKSHPTYEQFAQFVYDAASTGYTLDGLYSMFASGKMDDAVDALLRQHALGWRPDGKIVEGAAETRLLPSGER